MSRGGSPERLGRSEFYSSGNVEFGDKPWHELTAPRDTELRMICDDLHAYGDTLPGTEEYCNDQRLSLYAEGLKAPYINKVEGFYDEERDEVVVAVAGGKRITYEGINADGLRNVRAAAATVPAGELDFQVLRDYVYTDVYAEAKAMLKSDNSDYDLLLHASTYPIDVDPALAESLFYDPDGKIWFLYFWHKPASGQLNLYPVSMGNCDVGLLKDRLIQFGHDSQQLAQASTHEMGRFSVKMKTGGRSVLEIIHGEKNWHDAERQQATGKPHFYGRQEESVDAYDLFRRYPEVQQADYAYMKLLGRHIIGESLDASLKSYLLSSLEAQEAALGIRVETTKDPIISLDEILALRRDVLRGKIEMANVRPCERLMTFACKSLYDRALTTYKETGVFPDILISGREMESFGDAAAGEGGAATAEGKGDDDCPGTVGTSEAAALASKLGISAEEALRRLAKKGKAAYNASLWDKYPGYVLKKGICASCPPTSQRKKVYLGPCGEDGYGFCNDCDTNNQIRKGYIVEMLAKRKKEAYALAA